MNTQPITKQNLTVSGSILKVHSIFYTIQGEGPFTGHPAVFIRLGGCNLQCPQCDTDYTVGVKLMSVTEILAEVASKPMPVETRINNLELSKGLVVITGGEPLIQPLSDLANRLLDSNYVVQIETNGTLYDPDLPYHSYDFYIGCSPKTPKINKDLRQVISYYKYVLDAASIDPSDGLPIKVLSNAADKKVARPGRRTPVYLQPVDDKTDQIAHKAAVANSCKAFGYYAGVQLHKILGVS